MPDLLCKHAFPLKDACLCLDCDSIGNSAIRCPACASEALLPLAGVLNREEKGEDLYVYREFDLQRETESVASGVLPSIASAVK